VKYSLCCVNTITCKVGLIHEQNVRKHSVAMIVAIHKILHYLSNPPLKTVLGEGDKDKNHHRSESFITLRLQYQPSSNFCTRICLDFTTLHPENFLSQAVFAYILCSVMGKTLSPSKFRVHY